jgi:ubiquinone biosynthesis monooxygenase Coq6
MATLTENFNLQHALLRHLSEVPTVRILQRTKVTSIQSDGEQHGSWPLIHLDNQQVLRARLLVRISLPQNVLKTIEQIFRLERTVLIRQSGRLLRYLRTGGHMMLKLSLLQ